MPVKQQRRVSAVLGALVLSVVLPHMLGSWYTVLAVAALPLLMAIAASMELQIAGVVCAAGLALMALPFTAESLALPMWLAVPVGLWLVVNAVYVLLASRLRGRGMLLYWGGACAAVLLTTLALAGGRYHGQIIDGLASSLCARIEGLPVLEKPRVLLMLYQAGFARLETETAQMLTLGVKLAGVLGISPEIQLQLINSFCTTVEQLLPSLLPEIMVQWAMLTVLLTAFAGDETLRWQTGRGRLPRLSQWYMPVQTGRMMLVIMLLGVVQLLTRSIPIAQTAIMCRTLGYWAFAVQGAACLMFMLQRQQASRMRCTLTLVLGLLIAPFVLMLIGLYDQFADPRKLREDNAADDEE
ncbi:MAG: DUF2232 domain-containing protein [Clostridia bacterium]|nr:DUF2232 domain-containing protein [Clostridia bacterium]